MLKITKKGDKYWLFEDSEIGLFSPSKFTINLLNNEITIVYENGLKSKNYNVIDCEIYDLGATSPFTTSSGNAFMQKLEELNCPCFQKNENIFNISGGAWGDITGNLSNQTDLQTALDSKLDKVSTAGVERVYTINPDGSQDTKPTSELGVTKRIYTFSIPVFIKTAVGSVNEFIGQPFFSDKFILSTPTGITNNALLIMSARNVVTEVPFNCVLKRISIINSSNFDGVISIWKTDSNGVSNPVVLYYGTIGSSFLANINLTSSNINKYDKIQFFVARTASTTLWQTGLHLTFEEL